MATKKQILTKLKKEINKKGFTDVDEPKSNEINNFIWIGAQNRLIGNDTCHYEFIFHEEETPNILNLEVHFEDENCNEFENVLSKKYKETFAFIDWNCGESYKRIIGKDSNYCIQIDQYNNVGEIVNSAIELLEKLDDSIGYSLAKKCDELKPKASLSQEDGNVVEEIEYKKRFINYKKIFHTKHGSIQKALVENLADKYDEVGFERTLSDIRVDVLGINKNGKTNEKEYTYDIYEVKPYDSPTDCIREALGQLLYYKYQFEKIELTVGNLFVVGQNKLGGLDRQYLEKIQKSLPKIDYITPK